MQNSISFLICFFCSLTLLGQKCETYDRELFHMLPKDFPGEINCMDSCGSQQGWWIKYKIEYNLQDIPDDLPKGFFVDSFKYGRYKDGKKVGDWKTINNRHQVYQQENINYLYKEDTTIVTITYGLTSQADTISLCFTSDLSWFQKTVSSKPPEIIEYNKAKAGKDLFIMKTGEVTNYLPLRYFEAMVDYPEIKFINGKLKFEPEQ